MHIILLHTIGVFLLLGLGAMAGGYTHERLWLTSKKADPFSRTVALVMFPWWVGLTFFLMGPKDAFMVAKNFWGLITKGDYDVE